MPTLKRASAEDLARDGSVLAARLLEERNGNFAEAIVLAFGHGQAVVHNQARGRRTCRVCGCWELSACHPTCSWVEADLCSRCVGGAA